MELSQVLSGRRINDSMGKFVAENTVKKLIKVGKAVKGAQVLILGLTFKENVGDIRNTKVVDIISEVGVGWCRVRYYCLSNSARSSASISLATKI